MVELTSRPEFTLTLADAFGTATVLVAASYNLPQLVSLCRGNIAGVSIASVVNTAISYLAWAAYAVWARDGWLLASSFIGLPGTLATAAVAIHRGGNDPGRWGLPAVWTATLAAAVLAQAIGLFPMVPLVIGTSIVWTAAPALVTAWRSGDVSGIAAGTWYVQAGEALLYLGYGYAQREEAATAYGVAALVGSTGVLARLGLVRLGPAGRGLVRFLQAQE